MSWRNDSAGATLAAPSEMHFSHQGKPLLITRLLNPHFFDRRVATWQVWHDWRVQAVLDVSGGLGALLLVWLAWWVAGIDPQQGRGERTLLSARAV